MESSKNNNNTNTSGSGTSSGKQQQQQPLPPPPQQQQPSSLTSQLQPLPPPPRPPSAPYVSKTLPLPPPPLPRTPSKTIGVNTNSSSNSSPSSGTGTNFIQQQVQQQPHHTTTPSGLRFESAPSSNNISFDEIANMATQTSNEIAYKASQVSNELLQGAVDFFQYQTTQSPAQSRVSDTNTSTPRFFTPPPPLPSSPPLRPTVVAVPPPPPRTPTPTTATTTSLSERTLSSSSGIDHVGGTTSSNNTVHDDELPQQPLPNILPYTRFRPKEPMLLSHSQTTIPILLVATERAHHIAYKNQLRLSDLFDGLAVQVTNQTQSGSSSNSQNSNNNQQKSSSSSKSNAASSGSSSVASTNQPPLPPFRSVSRTIQYTFDDIPRISFTEPDKLSTPPTLSSSSSSESTVVATDNNKTVMDLNEIAYNTLQDAVVLQDSDGNLQHELAVLEDQIDNLLYDHHQQHSNNNSSSNHGNDPNHRSSSSSGGGGDDDHNNELDDLMGQYQRIQRRKEQAYKDAYQLTSPLNIPWLYRYRLALDETTTWNQQHDLFHCPIIILTICTTSEENNPFQTISMLQNQQQYYLPKYYYQNGLYDLNHVRQEVLVLHDNVTGPKQWDETSLRQSLQRTYGQGATVLRVNSIPPITAQQLAKEESYDLWGGNGSLGTCLSDGDKAAIRKYLYHFVRVAVLPALEKRIFDLNVIVNDRKKGVKNVLKSLWGGGRSASTHRSNSNNNRDDNNSSQLDDRSSSGNNTNNAGNDNNTTTTTAFVPMGNQSKILYRYDTIESQTRLLGDTLFQMKDYENALSMYRLIKDDYKQDKAYVHYGNIQEMIALCLYCIDPYRNTKEIFMNIETALFAYSQAASEETRYYQQQQELELGSGSDRTNTSAPPVASPSPANNQRIRYAPLATRLATRLCLVLASTSTICIGRQLEVADLLASASSGETALGAAVLLEQSAANYYQSEMYRKYAFHMLMSGHMYRSALNANHHAFRCFTSALHVYQSDNNNNTNGGGGGGQWDELQNHLRSALASLLFAMGRMAVALQLYAKLVGGNSNNNNSNGNSHSGGCGRVSIKSQQKFISNLLEICIDHRKKALAGVDRLIVPSKNLLLLSSSSSSSSPGMMMMTPMELRDKVRKERLDRIVQVIQYTKTASRVLEIPNMDLPYIHDSTLLVIAEEHDTSTTTSTSTTTTQGGSSSSSNCFGDTKMGSAEVWDDMMLWTTGELKAAILSSTNPATTNATTTNNTNSGNSISLDTLSYTTDEVSSTIKKALSKIDDSEIRNVVTFVEKEKVYRAMLEKRTKRQRGSGGGGKNPNGPSIRAQMEPISIEFVMTNPLGIPIEMNDLQIVAKMTSSSATDGSGGGSGSKKYSHTNSINNNKVQERICTNEDAISIKPLAESNEKKRWTFQNSNIVYEIADFCRISKKNNNNNNNSSSSSSSTTTNETWVSAEDDLEVPFFVVSKSDCTLEPYEQKRISISICPLSMGQLEIMGVRFRLLNSMIWIHHTFDIVGPLLQNTRTNRANRIRGESYLLKSIVERGMPCLNVDLVPRQHEQNESTQSEPIQKQDNRNNSGLLLQGQIGLWTLRMTNVGTAPATNITLKTNVPWVNIIDIDPSSSTRTAPVADVVVLEQRRATSYCIGPSGTLMSLPLDIFGQKTLQSPGLIQPGEFVDVPIEIRPSIPNQVDASEKKYDFYFLFRYELSPDNDNETKNQMQMNSSNQNRRVRWLKKMYQIPIYPSLSLSASIVPSYHSSMKFNKNEEVGEHILRMEFNNCRMDSTDQSDLYIHNVNVASRYYQIQLIPGQFDNRDTTTPSLKLGWQERATIHYKVVSRSPKKNDGADGGVGGNGNNLLSQCMLSTNDTKNASLSTLSSTAASSLLSFICLERAHDTFMEAITLYQTALSKATAQSDNDTNPRSIAEIRRTNAPMDKPSSTVDDTTASCLPPHPTSIQRLCPQHNNDGTVPTTATSLQQLFNSLHILCTWSDKNGIIQGEHHLRNVPLMKPNSKHTYEGCPITMSAIYPTTIQNDFTCGPAIVPIQILLRNRFVPPSVIHNNNNNNISTSTAIEIEYAVEEPDEFDFITCPSSGYRKVIKGGECFTIPLKALIPTSGTYDLLQTFQMYTIEKNHHQNNNMDPNTITTTTMAGSTTTTTNRNELNNNNNAAVVNTTTKIPISFPQQWMVTVKNNTNNKTNNNNK